MRNLAYIKIIHKSEVYFDVQRSMLDPDNKPYFTESEQLHRGELYIYKDNIYLFDGVKWYKANVQEIKEIRSSAAQKSILIHFGDFDLLLFSDQYFHLLALRDFLFLTHRTPNYEDNFILSNASGLGGCI